MHETEEQFVTLIIKLFDFQIFKKYIPRNLESCTGDMLRNNLILQFLWCYWMYYPNKSACSMR